MRRWVLQAALIATIGLGLATPVPAFAHANLERAEPVPGTALDQAPRELRLFFSEPVDASFSRVQVLNDRKEQVDRGDSRVAPNDPRAMIVSVSDGLPNGVFTVAWRTLSAVDGHTVQGAYPLIVGPMPEEGVGATAPASSEAAFAPETAVGRWWFYVAASALFGTLLAWQVVFRPLFGKTNPAALDASARRARRLAMAAGILLLVGTLYGAVAQAAVAADVPLWSTIGRPIVDLLGRGRFATLWWPRLALVVLALALVTWRGVPRPFGQLAIGASALALLTVSLNSHSAALLSGAYLGVSVDWIHVLAAAAWVGGLASLAYVLPVAVRTSAGGDRVLAQAVGRFSALALTSVAVLILTGTFQAWLHVGSIEGMVQTAYGLSITAKIGLLVLALLAAAFNLFIARPQLAALATREAAAASKMAQRFATAVRAELAFLSLALVVAAILTGISPAREELARRSGQVLEAGPVDRIVDAQGLSARVVITPATIGQNRIAVELPGTDSSQVERVQLTFTYLDEQFGSQPLVLPPSPTQSGRWEISSPLLSQAGTWQAELLIRRTNQDDARTALRFIVSGFGGPAQQPVTATGTYPLLPSPMVSVAYALVAAGGLVIVYGFWRALRQGRRGRRALQRQAAVLGAGLLILACGGYVYAQEQRNGVPLDVVNIRDPIPPDERSLAVGEQVYTTNCETCHGESGRGDGPAGLRLVPRPADLRIHSQPGVHTDGEMFYWVSYGFPGSAMPAWKDTLTEDERWDVINYIRATFGSTAVPSSTPAVAPSPSARP
ncbi:MAG TPA: CopD family protein [Chloroflexota bacterium]